VFFTLTLGDSYFPFLAYSCFPITFVAIGERYWLKKTNQLPAKQEQEARSILMLAYCDTNVLIIFFNNNAPDCGFYP